jgi:hypothetical protein
LRSFIIWRIWSWLETNPWNEKPHYFSLALLVQPVLTSIASALFSKLTNGCLG